MLGRTATCHSVYISVRECVTHLHIGVAIKTRDQYHQYLGNCPLTPPLTQQQSIDDNLGLILG